VGSVNSRSWSGYPVKTWLCTGVSSSLTTGGRHLVVYEFQYHPKTWRYEAAIKYGSGIPTRASEGNGIRYFDVYPLENFNTIGVSF